MKEVQEIYSDMLSVFEEKTGFAMEDTADLAVRLYAAAAEIQTLYAYADWALRQSFPQTASGQYLDYHAAMRGVTRKGGTKATGSLRFRIDTALDTDLPIPVGTVCTTAGLVRFVTTETGTIPAGSLYADVPAEAELAGSAGNVGAESITQMTLAPTGVVGVLNPSAFTGGSAQEEDGSLRERVLDSFLRLPNGANAAFYELRALGHAGVEQAAVLPRWQGIGTVGVVIASASGVPEQALIDEVQADIEQVREIAVDVTVMAPTVQNVNVEITLTPKAGVSADAAETAVRQAVEHFFAGGLLGRSIYRAALGSAVYATGAVENYRILSPAQDVQAQERTLPMLGTLTVTEDAP